jgi:hypothetical protein
MLDFYPDDKLALERKRKRKSTKKRKKKEEERDILFIQLPFLKRMTRLLVYILFPP